MIESSVSAERQEYWLSEFEKLRFYFQIQFFSVRILLSYLSLLQSKKLKEEEEVK